MLRITIQDTARLTRFDVEGELVGLWVKELEKCWENVLSAESTRAMLVNLASVTFIDAEGQALLTRMRRQGATLLSAGCLMNAIVAEIEAEVEERNNHELT